MIERLPSRRRRRLRAGAVEVASICCLSQAFPASLAYPGVVELKVDATDIDHKVMRVEETLPIPTAGPLVLLYPQWDPASHAPTAQANSLSGIKMTIDGREVPWRRDSVDPFAFHVQIPGRRSTSTPGL